MQLPAQVVDQRGALPDQPLAMIAEATDLQRRVVQIRGRERVDAFADRDPRDGQRVDLIRLARLAPAAPSGAGQPGRDAHDPLAAGDQEPLQASGDMPAVLNRPHAGLIEGACPGQHGAQPGLACRHGPHRDPPAGELGHRRAGMRALVRIDADHDHVVVPSVDVC